MEGESPVPRERRGLTVGQGMTYYEDMLTGSSERVPGGTELYTFERAVEENFPDWIFTSSRSTSYSVRQLNTARARGTLDSNTLGPMDEDSLPEGAKFRLHLRPLRNGQTTDIDFTITKSDGTLLTGEETNRVSLENRFKDNFRLTKPQNIETGRFTLRPLKR